jgi:hypothetical protein
MLPFMIKRGIKVGPDLKFEELGPKRTMRTCGVEEAVPDKILSSMLET